MRNLQHSINFLLAILAILLPATLQAADPTVTATLSATNTALGNPVQLSIAIEGTRDISAPPQIAIDDLQIQFAGKSQQFRMMNFQTSSTITLNYIVTPMRTGVFTIPAQSIRAAGKTYTTQPVVLTVTDLATPQNQQGNAAANPQGTQSQGTSIEDLARLELIVPKASAYVGESIPVVLRAYFDARVNFRVSDFPKLNETGFTVKKGSQPQQQRQMIDGREFQVVTFNRAITPVKPGKVLLGPAELQGVLEIPVQSQQRRSRSMFDDFFNNPFGRVQRQQIIMKSDPVELLVTALPTEDKPLNFTGAVGRFSMTATSEATRVNLGDPVTVVVTVEGQGDFDRVQAPELVNTKGWRSYPPTKDFTANDTLGLSGKTTFQLMLIPDENHSSIPPLELSYFDPTTEKYVTLQSEPIPLIVDGQPRTTPTPATTVATESGTPSTTENPTAPPATVEPTAPRDILHIRTQQPRWNDSFTPLAKRAGFWWFQLIPLLGCGALAGVLIWRRKVSNASARRVATLKKQREVQWQQLQKSPSSNSDFLTTAIRWLQLHTALCNGNSPDTIDCQSVVTTLALTPEETACIESLFARNDEARYAGGSGTPTLDTTFTNTLTATLKSIQHHG